MSVRMRTLHKPRGAVSSESFLSLSWRCSPLWEQRQQKIAPLLHAQYWILAPNWIFRGVVVIPVCMPNNGLFVSV
jgi:hypothetical protein